MGISPQQKKIALKKKQKITQKHDLREEIKQKKTTREIRTKEKSETS